MTAHDEGPLYWVWCAMHKRARLQGAAVDPRWLAFRAFREDMGERPAGLVLARSDPRQGYGPENCVWATRTEQKRLAWGGFKRRS